MKIDIFSASQNGMKMKKQTFCSLVQPFANVSVQATHSQTLPKRSFVPRSQCTRMKGRLQTMSEYRLSNIFRPVELDYSVLKTVVVAYENVSCSIIRYRKYL